MGRGFDDGALKSLSWETWEPEPETVPALFVEDQPSENPSGL